MVGCRAGVVSGGDEHAESGKTRVQQHGSASQRHQLLRVEDHGVLGRHADQGTLSVANPRVSV